jgi:hypothetical protein
MPNPIEILLDPASLTVILIYATGKGFAGGRYAVLAERLGAVFT